MIEDRLEICCSVNSKCEVIFERTPKRSKEVRPVLLVNAPEGETVRQSEDRTWLYINRVEE